MKVDKERQNLIRMVRSAEGKPRGMTYRGHTITRHEPGRVSVAGPWYKVVSSSVSEAMSIVDQIMELEEEDVGIDTHELP